MDGLSANEAREKLKQTGLNEIPARRSASTLKLFLRQFSSPLTFLLITAIIFSFAIGHLIDGILVFIILVLNGVLGFYQEYKASKELETLRKLEVSTSRVIRDEKQLEIPSKELVAGDLIILESGDKIPADSVLLEGFDFSVNESSLTGESLPVTKSIEETDNKLFFGTVAVTGRAKARVTFTGGNTRFGRLALTLSQVEDEKTPLEKNLAKLSQTIALVAFTVSVILFCIRLLHDVSPKIALLESIAVLVAAVPEGLPTAITFILVIGVRRMYQKKTLVRKLSAIESLGSTTIICTDKTGTLTENRLSVTDFESTKALETELLHAAVLCNSAQLVLKEDHGEMNILGDETEGALLIWAKEKGIQIDEIRSEHKVLEEIPFDADKRYMAVLVSEAKGKSLFIKGAPEVVLGMTSLTSTEKEAWEKKFQEYASTGLRVLAFAVKKPASTSNNLEKELSKLEFLGLTAIADTVRTQAISAVSKAQKAGIKVVMVTGDNELTAKAIGEKVGILSQGDEILLGSQLEKLTDQELDQQIGQVSIFARCAPEHKLRIVQSYQRLGEVVAVTGDGVNDSLALKQAQIGVSMGKIGTDVAKEASDIIILDDNLSTIVDAIEQGRLIYSNILKTVKFLMAGNLSEVAVIFVTGLLGFPAPLQPVQILWINFVTDGLPALSLAFDNSSTSLMNNRPRDPKDAMLGRKNLIYILTAGISMSVVTTIAYIYFYNFYTPQLAQVITFCLVVLTQMFYIFFLRRHHSPFSNKHLLYSVVVVLILQATIIFVPQLRSVFKIEGF